MSTGQYFPHQYNAHDDEKLQQVIINHGLAGYAVFFLLLEYLGQKKDRVLSKDFYKVLSWNYRIDEDIVRSVVEDYGLFEVSDNHFSSDGLNDRMATMDERIAKRRAAGALGGQKKAENRSKILANSQQNSSNASDLLENNVANSKQNSSKTLANSSNSLAMLRKEKEKRTKKEIIKEEGEERRGEDEKNTTNKDKSLLCCDKKSELPFASNTTQHDFHFDERVCDSDFLSIVANYMRKYACAPVEETQKLIDMMHPTWKGKYEDYSEHKADATQLWQVNRDRKYQNAPRASVAECRMIDMYVQLIAAAKIYSVDVLNAYRGMELQEGNTVNIIFAAGSKVSDVLENDVNFPNWAAAVRGMFGKDVQLMYSVFNG